MHPSTRHSFLRRLVALAIVASAWCLQAQAQEQRCRELGANCSCSEPMNTSSSTTVASQYLDPADSTTKECYPGAPYSGAMWYRAGSTTIETQTGMPAGSTVSRVWRSHGKGGREEILNDSLHAGTSACACATTSR